jgi:DinB family protein
MEAHSERKDRVRQAYRDAHARFVTRLREADAADVHRAPADGGWSAAQIGWHVAAVDASFAGVLSGEVPAAKPLPEGTAARPWPEIVAAIPAKLEAGKRVQPPADVRREDVLASLAESSARLDAALAALTEERAAGYAITHPVIGTVALAQIGEWATAHVIRHNAQAKRVLAPVHRSASREGGPT